MLAPVEAPRNCKKLVTKWLLSSHIAALGVGAEGERRAKRERSTGLMARSVFSYCSLIVLSRTNAREVSVNLLFLH